jgi:hypothetical protein
VSRRAEIGESPTNSPLREAIGISITMQARSASSHRGFRTRSSGVAPTNHHRMLLSADIDVQRKSPDASAFVRV